MTTPHPSPARRSRRTSLRLDLPFRRRDALRAGLTDEQLGTARFRRLMHGIYLSADVQLTPEIGIVAAMRTTTDDCFATHHSAALLLGAPVPESAWVHLGTVTGAMTVRRQVRIRRYAAQPPLARGTPAPCTDAIQTFLDLSAWLELVDLVVLGDGLVRRQHVTATGLRKAAAGFIGPGARLARQAAGFVRPGVESPMESRVRMLFVLAGLPEPKVNLVVLDDAGRQLYRLDLAWKQVKVAVEYDGRHHIDREDQWSSDLRRREELENRGWRIVVLTSGDVYRTPGSTLDRVRAVLNERGLDAQIRGRDWAAHFPTRSLATG